MIIGAHSIIDITNPDADRAFFRETERDRRASIDRKEQTGLSYSRSDAK